MARMIVVCVLFCAYSVCGIPHNEGAPKAAPDGTVFREDYQFHSEANGWFKFHFIPSTWGDARLACYLEGAHLASPVDEGILSAMNKYIKDFNKPVYTGVHSMASVEDYLSLDGIPLKKMPIKWAEGQPDNKDNNERCLMLMLIGMADVECNTVHAFLCYKKKVEGEKFATNECGTQDQKYVKNKRTGSCYKFHNTPASWYRAHSVCNAEGGHLAIFNSEEEAQAVAEIAAAVPHEEEPPYNVFIGFYYWPGNQNTFPDRKPIFHSTIDGKTLEEAGYAHWAPNPNPNQILGIPETCGTFLLKKNELYGLSEVYCYDSRPFVCEIDTPAA